ncbi:hypothetical protein PJ311_03550 [Bacillus sp. CLL-7-23]|uniref:Transmembrane protein n=1 Tax=Bacillus changyiensis TaxID=3004103 RepID=A0ABT4X2Q7_9BACI|nr:hypothetical protein [Bacillus changyiensis]MDA7025687.1 hypothetical protein [Bacillus changyiensis]
MIRKMIEMLDGECFDLLMEKVLKVMFGLIMCGCFPYFLFLLLFN